MKLDLHIHTNCSDGSDSWITILQKAEKLELDYISITDHNNCDVYFQMKNPEKYFSGKIVPGIEPECFYMGRCIELLGYGIDVGKMRDSLEGLYMSSEERGQGQLVKLYAALIKGGVKLSPNVLTTWDKEKHYYAGCHLLEDLKKYPENRKFIPDDESWNNGIQFYRNYACNAKSPFYIDESDLYPSATTIYNLIKRASGLVFIPHVFAYGDDSIRVLESLMKDFKIDGIECFYNSFTPEQTEYLLNFCKKHNLLVSAGSDYHGVQRPHIKLGVEDVRLKELTGWLEGVSVKGEKKKIWTNNK